MLISRLLKSYAQYEYNKGEAEIYQSSVPQGLKPTNYSPNQCALAQTD